MSDGVLASIIAACATVFTSFLQLRSSFAKEVAARAQSASSRRKSRLPLVLVCVMLGGAAVGGFALSQWLTEHERTVQNELLHALQERIATMTRTEGQLEQFRAGTNAEIEAAVMRRLGMEGVVVMATVAPCKPPLVVNTPALAAGAGESATQLPSQGATSSSPPSTCTEGEASPVTLCATVPAGASVTEVELYVRGSESDVPWASARVTPGHEFEQARFAEKPVEVADGSSAKQVCESFAQWSTERARVARMLVRYSL
jgi:hypothetical protein